MRLVRRVLALMLLAVAVAIGYFAMAYVGMFGRPEAVGEVTTVARSPERVAAEADVQRETARGVGAAGTDTSQILFGDLHVHTTFSMDAFLRSLPLLQGEGAHPPADACDFARFCSALDFFSINDHAEGITPDMWRSTIDSIRQCEAVAGDRANPDLVPFLGWEWTQIGARAEEHYGHKNVVLRDLDPVPTRPIAASGEAFDAMRTSRGANAISFMALADFPNRQRYYDLGELRRQLQAAPVCAAGVDVRELPADCVEAAETPRELFEKLAQWDLPSLVIPHGNAWGNTTPTRVTWEKQLADGNHDPERQTLIEVYSGHGNSEEYRPIRHVLEAEDGALRCPEPSPGFEPSCWRAGEIIRERCLAASESEAECETRAALARQHHVDAGRVDWMSVPGQRPEEWLDAGQCSDCFQPAFDYRPGGSTQYALSVRREAGSGPDRFRFGFIASSDTHTARGGSGYKEFSPTGMTDLWDARGIERRNRLLPENGEPEPRSRAIDPEDVQLLPGGHAERSASFYYTGGLVAVHAAGRDRASIWQALDRREVYGTSGPRILLWFELLNPAENAPLQMGGETRMRETPRFRVRAAGARRQLPGCPDDGGALSPERLEALCRGECHHPGDERLAITRIEVVRVRPRLPGESPESAIDDPWRVLECAGDASGCISEFSDPDFVDAGRDAVYYVRAIQEPTPQINGGQPLCERDADGRCLEIELCGASPDAACLAEDEARAWSSPIYVDFAG